MTDDADADRLRIAPITFRAACEYIVVVHRHHKPPQGMKFCVALRDGTGLRGIAVAGRPVSRHLDDGSTLEVTRLCTDGVKNGCSMLYSACRKIGLAMGYTRIITYILETESGGSLKASSWHFAGMSRGGDWSTEGSQRKRITNHPTCEKQRWETRA